MSEDFSSLLTQVNTWPNPAVEQLAVLVGTWNIEMLFPGEPDPLTGAQAIFEWHDHGYFLIERSHGGSDKFPKGYAIIGGDGTMGSYTMLSYDSRGVSRIYQMSLKDGVWKFWRDDPSFYQRFKGTFSEDGKTINAVTERSADGVNWEIDFHLTYIKVD